MYVKMKVPECDFTSKKYSSLVDGAGCIARGASGRWCVVMYAGPEFLSEHNIAPQNADDLVKQIIAKHPNDTIDF